MSFKYICVAINNVGGREGGRGKGHAEWQDTCKTNLSTYTVYMGPLLSINSESGCLLLINLNLYS